METLNLTVECTLPPSLRCAGKKGVDKAMGQGKVGGTCLPLRLRSAHLRARCRDG